jgi:hypothetical protein
MAHVNFNFESQLREDKYRSFLLEIYALEIVDLIFEAADIGFYGEVSVGLVHGQCIGCQFNCGSEKDHDLCFLHFADQIEFLFDFALAKIEERKITHLFKQKISTFNQFHLPEITPLSPFIHFLNGEWRKNTFLTNYTVYSEILDRAICQRHMNVSNVTTYIEEQQG